MANKYVIVAGELNCGAEIVMSLLENLGQAVTDVSVGRRAEFASMVSRRKESNTKVGRADRRIYELDAVRIGGLKVADVTARKVKLEANTKMKPELKAKMVARMNDTLKVLNDNQNKAVMLSVRSLMTSDKDVLSNSKIIVCIRDPKYIGYTEAELNALPAPRKETILRFVKTGRANGAMVMPIFAKFLQANPTIMANTLMVDYETLIKTPEAVIPAIIAHLGVSVGAPAQASAKDKVLGLKVQRTGKYSPATPIASLEAQADIVSKIKSKDVAGAVAKEKDLKDAKKEEAKKGKGK